MMPRMGPPSTARQDNPLYVSFRNPQWPPNFINRDNVLDYFCNQANTFYEMNSCNQQIKMQNITNRSVEECLRTMQGVQYVVWYAQPPLFIICKQRRNNVNNVSPISYYYVVNGSVHQAPDMYSLIQSRLLGALEPLRNAFGEVTNYSRYNTAKGYYWEFKNKPNVKKREEEKKDDEDDKLEERSTNFQKNRTLMLLNQLFTEMPSDDALEREEVEEEAAEKPEEASASSTTGEPKFAEPAARATTK
uniref:Mediator of RNA polymerase II transcription subunit 6 n=1 Tax=Caenorhabditis tropicalis TaxID=1561998 RepID=A0A1I7UFY3_9PELO